MAGLVSHFGIHSTLVRDWKRECVKNIGATFSGKTETSEVSSKSL